MTLDDIAMVCKQAFKTKENKTFQTVDKHKLALQPLQLYFPLSLANLSDLGAYDDDGKFLLLVRPLSRTEYRRFRAHIQHSVFLLDSL